VAQAFIPNLDNLPEVNHIDRDKKNCRWDNLEWTTHFGNIKHAQLTDGIHPTMEKGSQYHGVSFSNNSEMHLHPWVASVSYNCKKFHIGNFSTEIGAAWARNAYIIEHKLPNLLNDLGGI
jgi:hypothetical protein